jgi:anti-sigma regulatory factor (Ser/Thr protein kinase)
VVVEEIFVNIARYAYSKNKGRVAARLNVDKDKFIMQFEDEGAPFNPLVYKEVDMTAGIQERNIGGLGIHLVKKWMDEVTYERLLGKNILTIYKFIRR